MEGRAVRGALEIVLWMSMPIVGLLAYGYLMVQMLGIAGCEGVCREDLILGGWAVLPWSVAGSIAVAIGWAVIAKVRRRPTFAPALTGALLVAVSVAIATAMIHAGLAPMFDRNARIATGEEPGREVAPPPDPVGEWGEAAAAEQPSLRVHADGSVQGNEGCNAFDGLWSPGSEGAVILGIVPPTAPWEGEDQWLLHAGSVTVCNGYLLVYDESGETSDSLPRSAGVGD